jgi:hypothetical protein
MKAPLAQTQKLSRDALRAHENFGVKACVHEAAVSLRGFTGKIMHQATKKHCPRLGQC